MAIQMLQGLSLSPVRWCLLAERRPEGKGEGLCREGISRSACSLGCFFLATSEAIAQEVVHALCGTIRSINSTDKTITIGDRQWHPEALQ